MQIARRRAGGDSAQRSDTFTGTVFADPILTTETVIINGVFFTPGARSYWHSHDGGQVLTVEKGRGLVGDRDGDAHFIEAADVVHSHPGEEHWHGAAPGSFMLHTSISIGTTRWLEEVNQTDYEAAVKRAEERLKG